MLKSAELTAEVLTRAGNAMIAFGDKMKNVTELSSHSLIDDPRPDLVKSPLKSLLRRFAISEYKSGIDGKEVFDEYIRGNACLDIMIELYVNDLRFVHATKLIDKCGLPQSTGIRWLKILQSKNYVEFSEPITNGLGRHVKISRDGLQIFDAYFMRKLSNCLYEIIRSGESMCSEKLFDWQ